MEKGLLKIVLVLFVLCGVHGAPYGGGESNAAAVQLPQTGQTKCYTSVWPWEEMACANTGQDADKKKGVAWTDPRFTDNSNGTVTDNLTGLVWLKNANCIGGVVTWQEALDWSNALPASSGQCGLSDGSTAGQWRLPSVIELESLFDAQAGFNPNFPQQVGTLPGLTAGHPFIIDDQPWNIWTSTTVIDSYGNFMFAYTVHRSGRISGDSKAGVDLVWPVRDGL
jgi:hypothetical protein